MILEDGSSIPIPFHTPSRSSGRDGEPWTGNERFSLPSKKHGFQELLGVTTSREWALLLPMVLSTPEQKNPSKMKPTTFPNISSSLETVLSSSFRCLCISSNFKNNTKDRQKRKKKKREKRKKKKASSGPCLLQCGWYGTGGSVLSYRLEAALFPGTLSLSAHTMDSACAPALQRRWVFFH